MIKQATAMAVLVGAIIFICSMIPASTVYKIEVEEEPSIPTPLIDEGIATSTEAAEEQETEELPENVICTSDCPLIVVQRGPDEAAIREYFSDIPIMIEVARCESTWRQYEPDGSGDALRNRQGSSAKGAFQIMDSWHRADAFAMGYDTHTLEGNLGYARVLYEKQGLKPWEASRYCWGSANMAINKGISDT